MKLAQFATAPCIILFISATVMGQTVPAGYQVQSVVSGISQPTCMAFLADDDFFVLEKASGIVKRVQLPGPVVTNVLTLSVNTSSERGLLGIALHPDFANNGWVYLYYTNNSPLEERITRYTWSGSILTSPTPIANFTASPGPNHNGGVILFGPDGKLYAVIGDLNHNDMTQNYSGAAMSETGVIFRLNDDGTTPSDNPFTTTGWERFYAYGVRNSFGLAFDPLTDTLWDSENGPGDYDEINRVVPGMNSGWEDIMGPDSRDPQNISDLVMIPGAVYVDPAFSWLSTVAPTGIRFLNSIRFPASLRNDCFVGDANNGFLYHFVVNKTRTGFTLSGGLTDGVADNTTERNQVVWGSSFSSLTDIQIGPDGYMYVASIGSGNIYRIRPINPMGDINLDGSVTMDDLPLFAAVLAGTLTDAQSIALSDFDGDGVPTGLDIDYFTQALLLPS